MQNIETPSDLPPPEDLFCRTLGTLPRAWDSTMLGLLKECPKKFYYIIILGWQPNGFAAHLAFGIAYHKALETYDHDRFDGCGHDEATINAVNFIMGYGYRDSEDRFHPYDSQYTLEPAKTRDTLLRSVIWYLEEFKDDPAKTVALANGRPAVELSFKIDLPDLTTPDGDSFILAGHLDRVVDLDGNYYVHDRKTSKNQLNQRFWKQFNPSNQMSLYYNAGQVVLNKPIKGIVIDAVETGVTFSRFARHPIYRTPGQQAEWLSDLYIWIGLATQFATDNHWPMNDKSCSNYGGCPFQSICARDPKVRESFLKGEGYHKRQWNPLLSRVIPWLIPFMSLSCLYQTFL